MLLEKDGFCVKYGNAYLTEPKTGDDEKLSAYEEEHDFTACVKLLAACLLISKD